MQPLELSEHVRIYCFTRFSPTVVCHKLVWNLSSHFRGEDANIQKGWIFFPGRTELLTWTLSQWRGKQGSFFSFLLLTRPGLGASDLQYTTCFMSRIQTASVQVIKELAKMSQGTTWLSAPSASTLFPLFQSFPWSKSAFRESIRCQSFTL